MIGRRRSLFPRRRARDLDRTRQAGLAAAVGLEASVETSKIRPVPGGLCPGCGRLGRIDMVDTTTGRAYLSCAVCATQWDTDRAIVHTAPGGLSAQ